MSNREGGGGGSSICGNKRKNVGDGAPAKARSLFSCLSVGACGFLIYFVHVCVIVCVQSRGRSVNISVSFSSCSYVIDTTKLSWDIWFNAIEI